MTSTKNKKSKQVREDYTRYVWGGRNDPRFVEYNGEACYDTGSLDCEGAWGEYEACSDQCNGGTKQRQYSVSSPAVGTGQSCEDPDTEMRVSDGEIGTSTCNEEDCVVDCVGDWGDWGDCSETCGGGEKRRVYEQAVTAYDGYLDGVDDEAVQCDYDDGYVETDVCNTNPCPIDCVGSFGDWETCSEECGGGTQTRTYNASVTPQYGGAECPGDETQVCNTHNCPIDCEGEWGDFGDCSEVCGDGTKTRSYSVSSPAEYGGADCSAVNGQEDEQDCNLRPCTFGCKDETACNYDATVDQNVQSTCVFWGEGCDPANQCSDPLLFPKSIDVMVPGCEDGDCGGTFSNWPTFMVVPPTVSSVTKYGRILAYYERPDDTDTSIFPGFGSGLYYSSDYGQSWYKLDQDDYPSPFLWTFANVVQLATAPDDTRFIVQFDNQWDLDISGFNLSSLTFIFDPESKHLLNDSWCDGGNCVWEAN